MEEEILKFLPLDIIGYQEKHEEMTTDTPEAAYYNQMSKLSQRRRKKVYITTDCTCDIPTELLEMYDIKLMYLYIKTPNGRFADTREIDSDSIEQYISPESSSAYGDKVSVEEYEEFFADALTQAEEVVHISLASKCGKSYGVACMAATGFDHVHVVGVAVRVLKNLEMFTQDLLCPAQIFSTKMVGQVLLWQAYARHFNFIHMVV